MQTTYSSIYSLPRQIRLYPPEYHNHKCQELWMFGPNYRKKEMNFRRDIKKRTLNLVLDKSESNLLQLLGAMRNIEESARAAYDDDALQDLEGTTFLIMMAEDGCFFLLLAFTIIGADSAGNELNFPLKHAIFGTGCVREKLEMWLSSLFLVGNQIPLLVLHELMKLSFFQKLKTEHEWPQPLDLAKGALHKLLMADHQLEGSKPVDLIHCLQLIIIGTKCGLHVNIPITNEDSGERRREDIPSARELSELGIKFEILEGEIGSGGIHYRRGMFNGILYLPVFKVDKFTELVMGCLHKYEIVQRSRGIEPDASSFFKVLTDLIRTPQDAEVLASQGVIQGQRDGLPKLLMRHFDDTAMSQHLRRVSRDINKHPPRQWWKHMKMVIKIVGAISAILGPIYILLQIENNIVDAYKHLRH